ncbi:hypothetical protein AOLI_G00156990 [Acnodon oligacanthus]
MGDVSFSIGILVSTAESFLNKLRHAGEQEQKQEREQNWSKEGRTRDQHTNMSRERRRKALKRSLPICEPLVILASCCLSAGEPCVKAAEQIGLVQRYRYEEEGAGSQASLNKKMPPLGL